MKILVAFYSRTGTTKRVAQAIADKLECDIEEIFDTEKRDGILGWVKSGRDAGTKKLTKIREIRRKPSSYDLVIIGTPVWNNTMSTPIRTYVTHCKDNIGEVAFFCTQGSKKTNALQDMTTLFQKEPITVLELRRRDVETSEFTEEIEGFISKLKTNQGKIS